MREKILSFTLLFCLSGCSGYDYMSYSYNENTIYSTSSNLQFTEIIGFISPYLIDQGQKKYIVVDKLTDVTIHINKNDPSFSDSYEINTEKITNKELINDYWVTTDKIVYPVVINISIKPEKMSTAGEFASLINNYYTLPPGMYVCHLKSFNLTSVTGETNYIEIPAGYFALEVKEGEVSSNIGEYEFLVD